LRAEALPLPPDRFVDRGEELEAIHQELLHDGTHKTVVVHGLGGMGKTQLATKEYSAVFWINSKDVDTLKQGHVTAAKQILHDHPSLVHLKAIAESSNLDEAMESVKQWLSHPQNTRWLVIYDNYDTPKLSEHDEGGTFDLRPFLPEVHQGAILITTRSSQLRLGRSVVVRKLQNIEDSIDILAHASGREELSSGRSHLLLHYYRTLLTLGQTATLVS
jgi:hypothetical protein